MKQKLEEAAKEAIHKHYNCNGTHPCSEREYCKHCNGHNSAFDCCECGADEFKEGFIIGAKWQKTQSSWISVEERLPEKDGRYLVTDGEFIGIVYFFKDFGKFAKYRRYPHPFYEDDVIKLWMPIPSFNEILEANKDVLE